MSPAGRPKLSESERKHIRIDIRVTEQEKAEIERIAEKHGMTVSQAILEGVRLLGRKKGKE